MSEYSKALSPGTRLDDGSIELEKVLGIGGFGISYKAIDYQRNTEIAVKEYFPSALKSVRREGNNVVYNPEDSELFEKFRRTFHKEALLISRFNNHPNIVTVYYAIEKENGTAYYAMEYMHGETLGEFIRREGRKRPKEIFELLKPIMDALTVLHKEGVFHRDISPENIFLDNVEGKITPKLIDFGAAYVALNSFTQTLPPVTKRGFSPPEQNMGADKQGPWTDVYALCATFYYAVTRSAPPSSADLLQNDAVLKRPGEFKGVEMPEKAQDVLMRGMAINRQKRIQTIDEFEKEMADALGIKPEKDKSEDNVIIPPEPPDPVTKHISTFLVCLIDNLVLLIGMLSIIIINHNGLHWNNNIIIASVVFFFIINLCLNYLFVIASKKTLGIHVLSGCLQDRSADQKNYNLRLFCFCLLHDLGLISLADELISFLTHKEPLAYKMFEFRCLRNDQGETRLHKTVLRGNVAKIVIDYGTDTAVEYPLEKRNIIGREKGMVDVLITGDDLVSRMHCEINRSGDSWCIIDTNSSNGTKVNGEKIESQKNYQLNNGDIIHIGNQNIIFNC